MLASADFSDDGLRLTASHPIHYGFAVAEAIPLPAPRTSVRDGFAIAAVVTSAASHLLLYRLSAFLAGHSAARARAVLRHWSVRTCRWLRLPLAVHGTAPAGPCVYIANHRSYLDIPVLASALGATFMSRADVARWWIVGPTARFIDAVFVDRDALAGRVRAARMLARRARAGSSIIVFPEGTTGGDRLPRPFRPGAFRLFHRLDVPVVPVTIRYGDRRAYWTEEVGLGIHLRTRVLAGPPIAAAVHIGGVERAHSNGESLARAVYQAVCDPIERFGELA
jgi:1-acyl-sn-glycerol-3-phosphate acyltransferase